MHNILVISRLPPPCIDILEYKNRIITEDAEITESVKPESKRNEEDIILYLEGTTKDSLTIPAQNFIFAKSEGNYIRIMFKDGSKISISMLRMSINSIQDAVKNYPLIVRCHRSYLVNMEHVRNTERRANGMTLVLKDSIGKVPVSRSYNKELRQQMQVMKSAMLGIVLMLGVTFGFAGNTVVKKINENEDNKYIQYMDSIDKLETHNQNLKAIHVAHNMMNMAKKKRSSVGIVCASYKLYQLYTIRRNNNKSTAYIDTMMMYLPEAKKHGSKALKHCLNNAGKLRLDADQYEREQEELIDKLKKAGKHKEALDAEIRLRNRIDSIYYSLADEDCIEIDLARENDSLMAAATKLSIEIAKGKMESVNKEKQAALLASTIANMNNMVNKGNLEHTKLLNKQKKLEAQLVMLAKTEELDKAKAESDRNKEFIKMLYVVGVLAIGIIMIAIYYVVKNKRNIKRVRKTLLPMALLGLSIAPHSARAQGISPECNVFYLKANASINDSSKFFMYLDSLKIAVKKNNDGVGDLVIPILKMLYYTRHSDKKTGYSKLINACQETRDVSKKYGVMETYWFAYSQEITLLFAKDQYEDCYNALNKMKADIDNDMAGHVYYNRAAIKLYANKGAKGKAEEALKRLIEANNSLEKKMPIVESFMDVANLENDPHKRLSIYEYALKERNSLIKLEYFDKVRQIAMTAGECMDRNLFEKKYNEYIKAIPELAIEDSVFVKHKDERYVLEAYKAAYEGNRELAYTSVKSIKKNKLFYKEIVAEILGDYDVALNVAMNNREERYKKYINPMEYDARTLSIFIKNDILRREHAEKELALMNIKTEVMRKEKIIEESRKDSLLKDNELLNLEFQKELAQEGIRKKEREMERRRTEAAIVNEKSKLKETKLQRKNLASVVMMLVVMVPLATIYVIKERRDLKDLELLEDVKRNNNIAA